MEKKATIFVNRDMKRSPSQLALEEYLNHHHHHNQLISSNNNIHDGFLGDICSIDDPSLDLKHQQDIINGFSVTDKPSWSPNLTPKHSSISVTVDSQSSICAGSPTPTIMLKGRDNQQPMGATSRSSQSDDDDLETEVGPYEQSTDPLDLKRIKRQASNRESAQRSRRRKQAQLADLETQAEQYRGENEALFKQLADATQQYKDALTNNRVLKSDVEALRAKVKLAEDMVARRSSVNSSLSHLLQNYLNIPQSFGTNNLCRIDNVSPTITVPGGDDSWFAVSSQNPTIEIENVDIIHRNSKNGIMSDAVSCVSDLWSWESPAGSNSK